MINIPWLPVEGETCGKTKARKNKKNASIRCELPVDHATVYVGGLLYPSHLGRDKALRWHSWR
jgi:hypothetical protein